MSPCSSRTWAARICLLAVASQGLAPRARAAPPPFLQLDQAVFGGQESALAGGGVSGAGDTNNDGYADVIIGIPWFDAGQSREGRAQVHLGSALGLDAMPTWIFDSDQLQASLGWAVAGAGDVNADGYADIAVGAAAYSAPFTATGRVWVFHGSANGPEPAPAWVGTGNQEYDDFGCSVDGAGDVNGDGYDDLVVGAFEVENALGGEGRAYLFLGSAAGLAVDPVWVAEGAAPFSNFGFDVAGAGDVNGDGYDDVLVGAPEVGIATGQAYLYLGSASGLEAAPAWTADGEQEYDYFGDTVAGVGDLNADGFADVAVSAPLYAAEGRVWVYLGSAAGLPTTADAIIDQDSLGGAFGAALDGAGDLDADGYDDIVVGAPDTGGVIGRMSVYRGTATGLDLVPVWDESDAVGSLGYAVGGAGDVDGDGADDLVVGAIHVDDVLHNEGAAFTYLGGCQTLLSDVDADGVDDRCDRCLGADDAADADADAIPDGCDRCPADADPRNLDTDADDAGDLCDRCPGFDDTADADADGVPDGCEDAVETTTTDTGGDAEPELPEPTEPEPVADHEEKPTGCGCNTDSTRGSLLSAIWAGSFVWARGRRAMARTKPKKVPQETGFSLRSGPRPR